MEGITVWIDAWQMQCCGRAFNVGSQVEWDVIPWTFEVLTDTPIEFINYYYDNHSSSDILKLKGIVTEIYCVYQLYELDAMDNVLKPVSGKLIECNYEAAGWHADMGEYKFAAYFVRVTQCEVI